MKTKKSIYLEMMCQVLISLLITFLVFLIDQKFSGERGKNIAELYESLRNTSIAILTIISICISIMSPEEIKRISNINKDETKSKNSYSAIFSKCFVETIAIVVITVVIRIILIPVLNNDAIYKNCIDNSLFAVLCFLTLYQLSSVLIAITNFERKRRRANQGKA